mgnify:CR=1 FL=1
MDKSVALRKESVDRNTKFCSASLFDLPVALRKESVDRNTLRRDFKRLGLLSLSARRAWIEIVISAMTGQISVSLSARRAWIEIFGGACAKRLVLSSLSARRAWIEIHGCYSLRRSASVALRKESVDRNTAETDITLIGSSRSPQGERG